MVIRNSRYAGQDRQKRRNGSHASQGLVPHQSYIARKRRIVQTGKYLKDGLVRFAAHGRRANSHEVARVGRGFQFWNFAEATFEKRRHFFTEYLR